MPPICYDGCDQVCRHPLNRKVCFTEGVLFLAEGAGAFWLIDEIALIQPYDKRVSAQEFQVWTLTIRPDKTATLRCEDGNYCVVFTKEVAFTDFPLPEITLWFSDNTLYLPSEHRAVRPRRSSGAGITQARFTIDKICYQ